MTARRVTALTILGAFLALAVLSFLGDRVLSAIFVITAGVVLGHHALTLCARCSNTCCAFNPRAEAPAEGPSADGGGDSAYSDLPITRTTVIPLLLAGPLAFIAAWRFSPLATIAVAVVALSAHTVFRKLTCSECGNDCAGNCNARYRGWKRARRQTEA
jgi:hypothetical protein